LGARAYRKSHPVAKAASRMGF